MVLMDSVRRTAAAAGQVGWADLPPELLRIISGSLQNPSEIVRFRSVCRSWRSSASLPPNKLSALLPVRPPFFGYQLSHDFTACAVYLLRLRSDPSKAWIVSVQEYAAGKLVPRHVLSYQEINGLDLEGESIVATQIVRFYAQNKLCMSCNGVEFTRKLVFASEISQESGCVQLVGLCSYPDLLHCAFRLDLGGRGGFEANQSIERRRRAVDYVKFNGQVFAVDEPGHIYVLDHTNLQLIQLTEKPVNQDIRGGVDSWGKFVVSDGDLYVVWTSGWNRPLYEIRRLIVVTDENNNNKCSRILIEKVEDLGDRVFFITHKCSFSISAQLLPHPWRQGNCIFISDFTWKSCRCSVRDIIDYQHMVVHLGSQTITILPTRQGCSYLDLFSPPASFVLDEFKA